MPEVFSPLEEWRELHDSNFSVEISTHVPSRGGFLMLGATLRDGEFEKVPVTLDVALSEKLCVRLATTSVAFNGIIVSGEIVERSAFVEIESHLDSNGIAKVQIGVDDRLRPLAAGKRIFHAGDSLEYTVAFVLGHACLEMVHPELRSSRMGTIRTTTERQAAFIDAVRLASLNN